MSQLLITQPAYEYSQQEQWKCGTQELFTQMIASPFHILSHALFAFSEQMSLGLGTAFSAVCTGCRAAEL